MPLKVNILTVVYNFLIYIEGTAQDTKIYIIRQFI